MRRLVHTLTMLSVFAHMVLGCCWHHAHADQPAGRAPLALISPASHDHLAPHHHGGDPCGHGDTTCPRDEHSKGTGCNAGQCAFICSAISPVGRLLLDRVFQTFSAIEVDSLDRHFARTSAVARSMHGPPALPARAHLLNQVFLL